MATKDAQDALQALSEFASDNRFITIGDTKHDLVKLKPIDLAVARDYVVDQRITSNVRATRHMTLDPATRAKMMAEIQCAPMSTWDLIQDPMGRIKLLHLSVSRADPKVTLKQVGEIDPLEQDALFAYCAWVSGLLPEPKLPEGSADPLETTVTTP